MKKHLTTIIATGLYSGFMKPFPGTWGTIPAWLIAWFFIGGHQPTLAAATVVTLVLSVVSAGAAESFMGHDSRKIVIDEWVGMFIALLIVPHTLTMYLAAFVAFRIFDVVKLPPARRLEKLPGGWGVTFDDVAAGVQANIAVQILVYLTGRLA